MSWLLHTCSLNRRSANTTSYNPNENVADIRVWAEKSFISTLAAEKGAQNINPNEMNKSEASMTINNLKNKETQNPGATAGEPIQNPDSWSTGEDQATGKQTGYIAAMANKAGEKFDTQGIGKTEASKKIGDLKEKTGM